MRRLWILPLVVLLGLLPAPAFASGPIVVVQEEFQFQDINPCTGQEHTVFGAATIRIHEFDNEAGGRHHFNIQFFIDVTTSDGFSGRVVGPDIDNGEGLFGEEEGSGTFASLAHGVLSNPDTGQRFRVHFSVHFVQKDGEVKVDNVDIVLDCLGR